MAISYLKIGQFLLEMVIFLLKHGDIPIKNGDIPIKNGDIPIKNGDIPIKNGDIPIKKIVIFQPAMLVYPRGVLLFLLLHGIPWFEPEKFIRQILFLVFRNQSESWDLWWLRCLLGEMKFFQNFGAYPPWN